MKEPKNIVESMFLEEKRNKVASIIQTARVQRMDTETGRPWDAKFRQLIK
jgi:hypothetical protein